MTLGDGPPPRHPPLRPPTSSTTTGGEETSNQSTTVAGWASRGAAFWASRTVPWVAFVLVGLVRSDSSTAALGWGSALLVSIVLSVRAFRVGRYSLDCSRFVAVDDLGRVRKPTEEIRRFGAGSSRVYGTEFLVVYFVDGGFLRVRGVAAARRTDKIERIVGDLNRALAACRGVPYETIVRGQRSRPASTGITGTGEPAARALRLVLAIGISIVAAALAAFTYSLGQPRWVAVAIVIVGVVASVQILRRIH